MVTRVATVSPTGHQPERCWRSRLGAAGGEPQAVSLGLCFRLGPGVGVEPGVGEELGELFVQGESMWAVHRPIDHQGGTAPGCADSRCLRSMASDSTRSRHGWVRSAKTW